MGAVIGRTWARAVVLAAVVLAAVGAGSARAESWCAEEVVAHEWGVMVFDGAGKAEAGLVPLPSWIITRASPGASDASPTLHPVRALPPDGGERELPVLQFFTKSNTELLPIGVEVGFRRGEATAWFPRVSGFRSASEANSPAAAAALEALKRARAAREPRSVGGEALPPDPTAQLIWDHLVLRYVTKMEARPAEQPWVEALRSTHMPQPGGPGSYARLVTGMGGGPESFIFYEGRSAEAPAAQVKAAAGGACGCEVTNSGSHPLFDVLIVRRDPAAGEARWARVGSIAPGASATLSLSDPRPQAAAAAEVEAALLAALTTSTTSTTATAAVSAASPAAVAAPRGCVMGRDPALPTDTATDHTLYESEARALLATWGPHLLTADGVTVIYRESPAYLDAVMPLSIYTDMHHYITLHRLGLVAQRGLALTACGCARP